MLSKDGFRRDTLETLDGTNGPAPSNDAGPRMPSQRELDDLGRSCAVVEETLESIAGPAFLVDRAGAIHEANAAGRHVLANDPVTVGASLTAAVAASLPTREWSLAPLSGDGGPALLLAVLRTRPSESPTAMPHEVARAQWKLTGRQTQVLELVARGLTNSLVAEVLGIREGTVEYHLTALFDKAGVCNRTALIGRLLELGQRSPRPSPDQK
jgi:DNA-binding CsgD family transcriptional regulator